jgi:hypothetical protein
MLIIMFILAMRKRRQLNKMKKRCANVLIS